MSHSENTRKKILEAAYQAFKNNPYEKVHTKEIAKMAGISEALLFKYFTSKENLYVAMFEYYIENFAKDGTDTFFKTETPLLWLEEYALHLITEDDTTPPIYRFTSKVIQMQFSHSVMFTFHPYFDNDRILNIIKQGQESGDIRDGNPQDIYQVYWMMLIGILAHKSLNETVPVDKAMGGIRYYLSLLKP